MVGRLYFDIQLKKADSVNHRLFACVIKNLCKALLCLLTSITAYIASDVYNQRASLSCPIDLSGEPFSFHSRV